MSKTTKRGRVQRVRNKGNVQTDRSQRRMRIPRNAPAGFNVGVVRPPPSFLRGRDVVPLRLKATRSLINEYNGTPSAGSSNLSIAFTPANISAGGYTSLRQVFPMLNSMAASFSKFTVTKATLTVRMTTALTSSGYIAFCYEASGPDRAAPPSSISDATTGLHSGIVNPGGETTLTWNCSDYENDWSELSTEGSKNDCGSIQLISENSAAASAVVGMITLELDFFYAGYRAA